MFSCKVEHMKKNRQKWVQVKMEIGTSHKSYLKVILSHLSYQCCWQGSKLMGVEVSDRTISQDSPALQSSTLFAIVIVMIIIIIVVVIVIILILTTVCT